MEPDSDQDNQPNQAKYKKGQKQKEMRVIGKNKQIFHTANELYEAANTYIKTFKMIKNQHPKYKHITILDISLNMRGFQQDQCYTQYQFYRNNIRRGNTIIINKNLQEKQRFQYGRKGLIKFFDITQKSINHLLRIQNYHFTKKDKHIHQVVFTDVQRILRNNANLQKQKQSEKNIIHIYRLNKANGENAQVSYYQPTDQWVVASKNVAILVQNKDDLKYYDGPRYSFAKLIAQSWLKIIGQNQGHIQKLKKNMIGKTLVGEYCGNPEFQHLVKYQDVTIYFYAVVQNNSQESCIPPFKAFQFFNQFKIPIVKNYQKSYQGKYQNPQQFGGALSKIFSSVASSSIIQEEQGSVIYFVCEKLGQKEKQLINSLRVVTLGKLKTLEYRIFRKLRQKLRNSAHQDKPKKKKQENKNINYIVRQKYIELDKKFQEKYGSFQKQVKQLVGQQKLNRPLQYYFCVGLIAFEYTYTYKNQQWALNLLQSYYLDFLNVILYCIQNKKIVKGQLMTDEQLIKQLRTKSWQQYGNQIVKQYEQLLKNIVPKFWKVKQTLKNSQKNEKKQKKVLRKMKKQQQGQQEQQQQQQQQQQQIQMIQNKNKKEF